MTGDIIKLAPGSTAKWVARWQVASESNPNKSYVVARTADDEYACSCPVWIFQRKTCKHIRHVIGNQSVFSHAVSVPQSVDGKPVSLKEISRFSLLEF